MIKHFPKRKEKKIRTLLMRYIGCTVADVSPGPDPAVSVSSPPSLGQCCHGVTDVGSCRAGAPLGAQEGDRQCGSPGQAKGERRAERWRGTGKMGEEQVRTPPHWQSAPLISIAQLLSGPAKGPMGTPEQPLKPPGRAVLAVV